RAAVAGAAAVAAQTERERFVVGVGLLLLGRRLRPDLQDERVRAAAVAAAAADALRLDAVRAVAPREDVAVVMDEDCGRVVAAAALAADGDRDVGVRRLVLGDEGERAREAEAAVAAAAAEALGLDADRFDTRRLDVGLERGELRADADRARDI